MAPTKELSIETMERIIKFIQVGKKMTFAKLFEIELFDHLTVCKQMTHAKLNC